MDAQSAKHGILIDALEKVSADVPAELPKILAHEAQQHGAQRHGYDLIVMASHVPGLLEPRLYLECGPCRHALGGVGIRGSG